MCHEELEGTITARQILLERVLYEGELIIISSTITGRPEHLFIIFQVKILRKARLNANVFFWIIKCKRFLTTSSLVPKFAAFLNPKHLFLHQFVNIVPLRNMGDRQDRFICHMIDFFILNSNLC